MLFRSKIKFYALSIMSKHTNKYGYLIFFLIIAIPSLFIIASANISNYSYDINYKGELPFSIMDDNWKHDDGDINFQSPLDNGGKNWTVIFYGAHDNDLSSSIPAVGSNDYVDVIAIEDNIAWGDSRAVYIESLGVQVPLNLTEINPSWSDELNMANPNTLSIFVQYCIETYPANHYWVVLDNHGGAYNGVCTDQGSGGDILSIGDLKTAFSDITSYLGRKIEGIFFSACLMSNLEIAVQLSPYVEYIVGFETTSGGNQLDEDVVAEIFRSDYSMSAEEMAIELVDEAFITETGFMGMSAVKLSTIQNLIDDLNTFSTLLMNNFHLYGNQIKAARARCQGWYNYYRFPLLIDFVDFVEEVADRVPNLLIRNAALNLISYLVPGGQNYAILNNRVGDASDFMAGLSVYFPDNGPLPSYSSYQIGNDFCALTNWEEFLQTFYTGDIDTITTPIGESALFFTIFGVVPFILIALVIIKERTALFKKR